MIDTSGPENTRKNGNRSTSYDRGLDITHIRPPKSRDKSTPDKLFVAAIVLLIGSVLHNIDMLAGFSDLRLEPFFWLPIAAAEVILSIWLIVKGFNPSAIASGSAKTDTN